MRMSEPELQMELKKRGLIPEAIERPGLMQQLKKFFHDDFGHDWRRVDKGVTAETRRSNKY